MVFQKPLKKVKAGVKKAERKLKAMTSPHKENKKRRH